jgi:hypothetical protein
MPYPASPLCKHCGTPVSRRVIDEHERQCNARQLAEMHRRVAKSSAAWNRGEI